MLQTKVSCRFPIKPTNCDTLLDSTSTVTPHRASFCWSCTANTLNSLNAWVLRAICDVLTVLYPSWLSIAQGPSSTIHDQPLLIGTVTVLGTVSYCSSLTNYCSSLTKHHDGSGEERQAVLAFDLSIAATIFAAQLGQRVLLPLSKYVQMW